MSNNPPTATPTTGGKYRRVPSEVFLSQVDTFCAINLFGQKSQYPSKENNDIFIGFLKLLGTKYEYNWEEMEIAPTGELIHLVKEEDRVGVA